jgi:hypothetical protein
MPGASVYPGALDNFAEASPTNLGDNDTTGRTHSERHDDVEAAVEAVQGELGLNPSGTFATVVARLDDLDEGFGNTESVTSTTPGLGSKVFVVDQIGSFVVGSYVVVSSLADPLNKYMIGQISVISGLNITVVVTSFAGTVAADWVFSLAGPTGATGPAGSGGIPLTIIDAKGDLVAGTAADTAARLAVGTNGYVLTADSAEAAGLKWALAAAGATGGGTDQIFYENGQTITTSYSISASKNAVTAGPVTINTGITVTIPSGSTWVVV